jgi:excisionase family DNA binding protein
MSTLTVVEQLLEVPEVLALLHISRSKLHEYVRDGELRAVKFGRRTLFRAQAIQAFIEAHETAAVIPATANIKGR